ncbi:GlxA family transcriptional regulator [Caulobacter sp. 17J65-9]|uniref:GlxA family transcriptional regulator n=1 Tax=Caulobacter sp. 17J65-9 TaxID=2709382 RepID=UPI0013C69E78|nr:GlxA family transcriptional regulator [Caulobacter sp. 17J65-9]NEX93436.1 GlxA family transcriptional regulator [Caulobacter sp. 17J65-9]
MASVSTPPRKIALVGYRGVQSLDLTGPFEVFAMANRFSGVRAYEPILASPDGGDIVCNSGVKLADTVALADLPDDLDTILVGGGDEPGLRSMGEASILAWLNARARTTRRVGSVCSGAFVLAAAGMLDGRRATTHWEVCDVMRTFRPDVRLEPDAIFVADPPFYTSAGVTAGIDLCLSFVEEDCGPEVALAVARNLVLFMRRPGGQTQYSAGLNVQTAATPKIRTLIAEVSADPSGDRSLPSLADQVGMTERTFSRIFVKETGTTPAAFVEMARVDRAKALLETSDWPLARVADRSGFGSSDALHRAFHKRVGATPGDYRARFGRRPAAG